MAGWDQDIPDIKSKGTTEVTINAQIPSESLSEQMYDDLIDELRQARLLPKDANYSITSTLNCHSVKGLVCLLQDSQHWLWLVFR